MFIISIQEDNDIVDINNKVFEDHVLKVFAHDLYLDG